MDNDLLDNTVTINEEATPDGGDVIPDANETTPQSTDGVVSEGAETNTGSPGESQGESGEGKAPETKEEIIDWLKDKRAEKIWKKDPNNMYSALKGLEKSSTPIHMLMKEFGMEDHESLRSVLNDYQTISDPENSRNVVSQELETWMNDEGTRDQVVNFFNEMRVAQKKAEASKLLGYNVEDGQLTPQMVKLLEDHNTLKDKVAASEHNDLVASRTNLLDDVLDNIQGLASQYGIEDYSEDAFLTEVNDRKMKIEDIEGYFLRNALAKVAERAKSEGEQTVINNLKNKKFSGLAPTGGASAVTGSKDDIDAEFDAVLSKIT